MTLSAALAALDLRAELGEKLNDFMVLFMKWNRSINLSAARTEEDLQLHIIDSLHVVRFLRPANPDLHPSFTMRVLDVGAGGGLPSVVAAICLPEVHVTALEPVHKKHAFLRTAARELSLTNFLPLAERLDAHAARDYDAAMSRATMDLREWLEVGMTYVRPGGFVLGFEAWPRSDLPARVQRSQYLVGDKSRAIVQLPHEH